MRFGLLFFITCLLGIAGNSNAYTPAPGDAINVSEFGAVGDGVTDDGLALKNAYDAVADSGGNLAFEPGKTYLITRGSGMVSGSNFKIYGQDATIKVKDGYMPPSSNLHPFNFYQCTDFEVYDLTLDGNRDNRSPAEDFGLHNLITLGCKRFVFENIRSNNACNDGFNINTWGGGQTNTDNFSKDGKLINCSADNCFRNNMSIILGWNIEIIGGSYTNANGTWPQAGIDIEPNPGNAEPGAQNILIKGASFVGNKGMGVTVTSIAGTRAVTVECCYFKDNARGGLNFSGPDCIVRNCVFYDFLETVPDSNLWWRHTVACLIIRNGGGEFSKAFNTLVENNTIAKIKWDLPVISVDDTGAIIRNNTIYDFTGQAIDPASYESQNTIEQNTVIPDPGLPSCSTSAIQKSSIQYKRKTNFCNYPNPFNPSTTILFDKQGINNRRQKAAIYDIRGKLIKPLYSDHLSSVVWDGRNQSNILVSPGIYFVRYKAGKEVRELQILLMK